MSRRSLRTALNTLIVVVGLPTIFLLVALTERLRRGWGRPTGVWAARTISRACAVNIDVTGVGRLDDDDQLVYVPNHRSPLDIPAMLVADPRVRFAAAAELFRIPLLGSAMRALDSVPVDRGRPRDAAQVLAGAMADGSGPLVVFPEGGIPEPEESRRFQTGAFLLAIDAGATVVPVAIKGSYERASVHRPVVVRPGRIEVEILEPISTRGATVRDRKALRDRAEAAIRDAISD